MPSFEKNPPVNDDGDDEPGGRRAVRFACCESPEKSLRKFIVRVKFQHRGEHVWYL